MTDKKFKVKTGLDLPAPLPADQGGTGQTSLSNLLNSLLPVQTDASGKMLSSDGTNPQWATVPNEIVYSSTAPSNPVAGQVWINTAATTQSFDPNLIRRSTFVSTAGQTEYTVSNAFVDGYEQVFFNGVLLQKTTDYTTSGGTTITLVTAAEVNDLVEVLSVTNLNSTNTYTQAEIDSALSAKLSTTTAASTYLTQANATSTYATKTDFSNTAWTAYTPTLRTNGGTITLGNGTITGAYKQIGKIVHFRAKFTIGSSTAIGANEILIGLPVNAATPDYTFAGAALDSGNAWYSLTGVGRYLGLTNEFAMISYSGTGKIFLGVTNSSIFALLDGDYITISGSYEAA